MKLLRLLATEKQRTGTRPEAHLSLQHVSPQDAQRLPLLSAVGAPDGQTVRFALLFRMTSGQRGAAAATTAASALHRHSSSGLAGWPCPPVPHHYHHHPF